MTQSPAARGRRRVRIGNCSGYYGDRPSAAREMLSGGDLDVLTGDYLAEVTMYLLAQSRQRGKPGYARLFLTQLEQILGTALDAGTRVVVNAGGLEPERLAADIRTLAERLGLAPNVAHVEGDDLLPRLDELRGRGDGLRHLDDPSRSFFDDGSVALTANAYLGAAAITTALAGGADVVVCPRVTDASLVVGPAAWWWDWSPQDLDQLAGAVVAGHLIECGTQATGGNYSFFQEIPDLARLGFPIAEIDPDGSCVITKHAGTGGAVTVGTVTEQLLYEVGAPRYLNPDVTARFDAVTVTQEGPDRVRVSGAVGEPPPPTLKVSLHVADGYRNSVTFLLTGLDVEAKAEVLLDALDQRLAAEGVDGLALQAEVVRSDHRDASSQTSATAQLRVHARSEDADAAGDGFARAVNALPLATYPGCYWAQPPGRARPHIRFWPALVDRDLIEERVVVDGEATAIAASPATAGGRAVDEAAVPAPLPAGAASVTIPLGRLFGARSGDKGGDANVAVWARNDDAYRWLWHTLTEDFFRGLLTDVGALNVSRYEFPRVRALNFVVQGLLEDGALGSSRLDVQAKALGEYLRARPVSVPAVLVEAAQGGAS